jgi:hypothetical protein
MPSVNHRSCAVALAALVLGCQAAASPGSEGATLRVDPVASDLVILDGVPASASFTATLVAADQSTRDITDDVQFAIDPAFGAFTGNQLTMHGAGKTAIVATFVDVQGTAEVIGRVRSTRIDPSLPPAAASWFDTATEDPARAPTVVYPAANVAVPRNLGDFDVHWTDARNNVFEVALATEYTTVRVIAPGGNGAVANGSWLAFLPAEWAAAVATAPAVSLTVRGVDRAQPGVVGSAAPRSVEVGNEPMLGGLYYWAATATTGPYGIFRHDMSQPGTPAEQFMTTAQTGGRCVACHVLSRDGRQLAVTYDGGNGAGTFVDAATRTAQASRRAWNFGTFTPDGSAFLAISHGQLAVVRTATQATLATMPSAGYVTQPDLAPDGTKLVYVRAGAGGAEDYLFTGGKLFIRSFDPSTNGFGAERQLVGDAANNYYPSFSPDGAWVLFTRAASGSSYNNSNATLWVVKADGTGAPVALAKANGVAGLTTSWGRWAPFAQTLGASHEPIYWVTVSSKRDFGTRLVGARRPQIWMTAFHPERAAMGIDPSGPAFHLPSQSLGSDNHIAQWTEQVVVLE